jgi:hypothetical protein
LGLVDSGGSWAGEPYLSTWVDEIPRRHNQLEVAWPDERTQRDLDNVTPLGLPGAPLPRSVRRHDDEIVRNHTGEPVLLGGSHSGNHSAMSGLILRRQRGAVLARFIGRGKCQIWRERCRSDRRHAVANAVVLRGGGGGRRDCGHTTWHPPLSSPQGEVAWPVGHVRGQFGEVVRSASLGQVGPSKGRARPELIKILLY